MSEKLLDGVVLYDGPSMIDRKTPIVVIATGLNGETENEKTGAEVQTWILLRDVSPTEALGTGADSAICGGCKMRPKETNVIRKVRKANATDLRPAGSTYLGFKGRACYVRPQTFLGVWKAFKRNRYRILPTSQLADVFAGKVVRLGSYGDPAAVPMAVWNIVLSKAAGHTGYTHQWASERLREVTAYCQASVDSPKEYDKAKALGLATFRVRKHDEPLLPGEVVCPASAEAGKVTTCAACQMCDGSKYDAAIIAHGTNPQAFDAAMRSPRSLPVMA